MAKYLSKVGNDHLWYGKNNQDYCLIIDSENEEIPSMRMVLDGCGSGNNSEVGVQLFAQLFKEYYENDISPDKFEYQVGEVMKKLLSISSKTDFLSNNLFFTIVCVFELKDKFVAKVCGDGYLITRRNDDTLEYMSFDNGEYPKYILYNFLDEDRRGKYTEGVTYDTIEFSKNEFANIGVATDGLRYIHDLPDVERYKFDDLILKCQVGKIKMLINRNNEKFKDDITICI